MERKKRILAYIAVTVVALALVATVLFAFNKSTPQLSSTPKQVTLTGNLTCLPHKNAQPGQPQTLECAYGLRTKDQRHYGLQKLPEQALATDFAAEVEISGELSPPGDNEQYDIIGTITVSSFKLSSQ